MTYRETTFTFTGSLDHPLVGIIHQPEKHLTTIGLLIIVGGPQYRIGAHRQYVHMARHCAAKGIAAMRFDYTGIGDSDGIYPGFEHVSGDIHAAIDTFLKRNPKINSIAIWGLCEGASAILLEGATHKAVSHIILVNPWVRSETGLAKAYVKHYYLDRLKSPEFWKKIFSGSFNFTGAISGFLRNIKQAFGATQTPEKSPSTIPQDDRPFPERMLSGLMKYPGKALLIQSEKDLVAREFDDLITSDKAWKNCVKDKITTRIDIADTDHTFSSEIWRQKVASATADWLLSSKD